MNNKSLNNLKNLSKSDFDFISTYAKKYFGLNLTEAKIPLINSRISRRLRELGLDDFGSYRKILNGKDSAREQNALLSALTTNVTHFFRENHHFDILRELALPQAIKKAQKGERVRIWSAGCSTGQEPFSIAITLLDLLPKASNLDIKIVATDIDPQVLVVAKAGLYTEADIKKIPERHQRTYFEKSNRQKYKISEKVTSIVDFININLIEEIKIGGPVDIIFCRNVAIYFDKETQQETWLKLCNLLRPGGFLFIGHSERVSGPAESQLTGCGITTYQKVNNTSLQH